MKIKWKNIIFAPDTTISLLIFLVFFVLYPTSLKNSHVIGLYQTGIYALAIVFSVYFGGFAIVISSTDNDFINFLEKEGTYSYFIDIFKYALLSLFGALLYSIFLYFLSSLMDYIGIENQHKIFFSVFISLLFYGLLNALNAALDSIKFALKRHEYTEQLDRIQRLYELANSDKNISSSSLFKMIGTPENYIESDLDEFQYRGFTIKKVTKNKKIEGEDWWKINT